MVPNVDSRWASALGGFEGMMYFRMPPLSWAAAVPATKPSAAPMAIETASFEVDRFRCSTPSLRLGDFSDPRGAPAQSAGAWFKITYTRPNARA